MEIEAVKVFPVVQGARKGYSRWLLGMSRGFAGGIEISATIERSHR